MTAHLTYRRILVAAILAATLAAAGCNRSNTVDPADASSSVGSEFGNSGPSSGSGGITTQPLPSEQEMRTQQLMQQLVIYFDYDQAEILPEFNSMLAAHGQYLAANPNMQVRLEGHADERGSREYNIGLGERRAQSVRRILLLQGAGQGQLQTVSYGEERPAATGSDDEAWRLNRRVELVYR